MRRAQHSGYHVLIRARGGWGWHGEHGVSGARHKEGVGGGEGVGTHHGVVQVELVGGGGGRGQ